MANYRRGRINDEMKKELAAILHLSPTTLRSYIKNPEQMRLGTLRRLNRLLAIPADDARSALPMW